jgi:hypothetical protein
MGEWSLRGTLQGLDDAGQVQLDTDRGLLSIAFAAIERANLVLDFGSSGHPKRPTHKRGGEGKPAKARRKEDSGET